MALIEFSDLPPRAKDIAISDIMNHLKRSGRYPLGDRGVAPNTKFKKGNLVKISTSKSPNTSTLMAQYDGCWAIVVNSFLQYKNNKGKSNWYKKVPIYSVQHLYIIDSEDKPYLIGEHIKGFSWYWYHFSNYLTNEDALVKKKDSPRRGFRYERRVFMVMPKFKVGDIITFKYMIDKPENTPILIVKKISESNHWDYIVHAYVSFHTIKSYIGQNIYMSISGDNDLVLHPYVFSSLSMPSIPN